MKKCNFTFDSGAIALYFAGEEGIKQHFLKVFSEDCIGYICEINLAEFYYKTIEKLGLEVAETRYLMIRNSAVKVIAPNEEITRTAAILKVKYKNQLSLADCYAIATAKALKSTLITTDRLISRVKEVATIHFKV